ncbi:ABC transporter ATP-binding protein [Candidatus Nomurabacteria bacterium]|nr:ABC transporter ATP-binding protein [Candidatus Nomurabacteria bacterium]
MSLLRKIGKYVWPEVRKYRFAFFLVFFSYGLATTLDNILKPYILKEIIDSLASGGNRYLIFNNITHLAIWAVIVILIHQILYRVGDYSNAYFESKVMKELYDNTFDKLLSHSYTFFSNNFSGSLVAKTKRFVKSFEVLQDILSFQVWFSLVNIGGILIILFFKIPFIGFVFLIWSVFYIFSTFLFTRKKIIFDMQKAAADSHVTANLADVITNILNIKIFTGVKMEKSRFRSVTLDEEEKRRKSWYFGNLQNVLQAFMMAVLQITILFLNIHFWNIGKITVGTFVLIQAYMVGLFDILWNLGRSLTKAAEALSDMKEIIDILELKPDILDKMKPEKCKISSGEIKFNNVNFEYIKDYAVFTDFNLKIKAGEKIGLVGHSGSGKSTIVKIILRFSDIKSGEILIDEQNIANIKQEDLRSNISYVPQEPILFHRSIKDNIAYSKSLATEEEVIFAAKKAHAHEFIIKLPHGYDTLVGERGVKLSGGERQRVAIARAMLKDSPILMLDEATSSLDSISEHYIQDAFNELMKGKTTIVIAHRLSTIQKMDRIIVLDQGKIVEEGTHKELLAKGGLYKELWDHQTGGFLE